MKKKKYQKTEEHKRHIAQALLGRKASKKTRSKMSKAKKGVPKTEEHKKNIALAMRKLHDKKSN